MTNYKKPESVLIVIFCQTTERCLMLQRIDDNQFWQSVTGSLEEGEKPVETAIREVLEETGINIINEKLTLIDADYSIEFDIFPQFLHKYEPNIKKNKEHWFYLPLLNERIPNLTEHLDYKWLTYQEAASLTISLNNAEAINKIPLSLTYKHNY